MRRMLSMRDLKAQDLQGLTPEDLTALSARMLEHIEQQARNLDLQRRDLEVKQELIERKDRDIAWRDAKLEKITFELARLKRWKYGAKSEAMDAEQRQMFQDTLLEDEAYLEAQLAALRAALPETPAAPKAPRKRPRRQALPDHLRRVVHRHEPEDTHCTTADCGQPMTRVGEDISERLDIVPAEFFVHRHVYGKWSCRCCQRQGIERLVQEPADPQIIDGDIPASGLVAYTLISRFVDHLPYYRQEAINARSGVHTPRSTLAAWAGHAGAAMAPLHEAHKRFVLSCPVLHADETPVAMLDPGHDRVADRPPNSLTERLLVNPPSSSSAAATPPSTPHHRPSWLSFHAGHDVCRRALACCRAAPRADPLACAPTSPVTGHEQRRIAVHDRLAAESRAQVIAAPDRGA
jgi:transposase